MTADGVGRLAADDVGWSTGEIDRAVMADAADWLEGQLRVAATPTVEAGPRAGWAAPSGDAREPGESGRPSGVAASRVAGRWDGLVRRSLPTITSALLFNLAVGFGDHLAARVYVVAFLLVVPGAVVSAASRHRPATGAVRLALAAATSVLCLMTVAVVVDLAAPLIGVGQPLRRTTLLLAVDITLVPALMLVARHREPLVELFGDRSPTRRHLVVGAGLVALPVLAAAGSQAVDHGRAPALAAGVLTVCGVLLVAVVLGVERLPAWFVHGAIYAIAVATIYSFTFSGDRLFGWDIQQEFQAFEATSRAGTWWSVVDGDPYRAMLSITALPTVLTQLSGLSGISVFRGVYPLLFASLPVLVYVVAVRRVAKTAAAAAAAFVVAQLAFSQQLPAIARQEVGLMFFGVLVAVAFDDDLPIGHRRLVALLAGAALAFTHYSTAYVTSLAMLAAWLLVGVVRVVVRRERQARVLTLPVVLGVLAFTAFWNFGVTQSGQNVARFAEQAAERGPEFLPSGEDRSIVDRWLTGNAPQRISAEEYARRAESIYDAGAPWLNGYSAETVAAHPIVDASSPALDGLVPSTRDVHALLLVIASQGLVALTGIGVLLFAIRSRRDSTSAHEIALLGVALLGFVAAMRVSGVAAEAYNQERAQIHASVVISVGLAYVVARFVARRRTIALAALGGAIAVVFLASSGLAARLGGGAPPANLAATGDTRERFSVEDTEVAAVEWLAANRYPDSIVYADRYGKLRVWAAAVPIEGSSLQGVLTPATLDRNAYVLATSANVMGGRARGAIGADHAVYEFPAAFLDAHKATIYSNGAAEVFR